ncbi:M56/M15 family metallopeptidase [Robertkochia solimangrovi]|uniref:M56/M15 family metallopeptidase n=1 Tax=Robertkochia solimangrovi TaxID=2213046 RepID=UPI001180795A|nr:M56/M15 family metallopeptidase [Robertkochia solimangrovi]TRZ41636.1 hypothetical protein DMZ48_16645 [Robertkochia solimangrovi]
MTEFLIYNCITLGMFLVIYRKLLRRDKNLKFNRYYLLGTLIICVVAPLMEIDYGLKFPATELMNDSSGIVETHTQISPFNVQESVITDSHRSEIIENKDSFLSIVPIIYLSVSILLLLRFFYNLFKIVLQVISSRKVRYESWKLYLVNNESGPFSFFRMIFLGAEDMKSNDRLSSILLHESAHAIQLHSIDIILIELLKCLLWINPFLWIYKREITAVHEYLADDYVLQQGVDMESYMMQLIRESKLRVSGMYSGFNFINTKKRLDMLHQSKPTTSIFLAKTGLAFLLCFAIFVFSSSANPEDTSSFLIVIDPGHGGKDHGNLQEKNINFEIAQELLSLTKNQPIKIVLTRDFDRFLSLNDRVDMANKLKPDLFLSLHCNASDDPNKKGLEIYYSEKNTSSEKSKSYAKSLLKSYDKSELKSAEFIVLKNSEAPAILVELGFLTNEDDYSRLSNKDSQREIAKKLYQSLEIIRNSDKN